MILVLFIHLGGCHLTFEPCYPIPSLSLSSTWVKEALVWAGRAESEHLAFCILLEMLSSRHVKSRRLGTLLKNSLLVRIDFFRHHRLLFVGQRCHTWGASHCENGLLSLPPYSQSTVVILRYVWYCPHPYFHWGGSKVLPKERVGIRHSIL